MSEYMIGELVVAGRQIRAYSADDETYWRVQYQHGEHVISNNSYSRENYSGGQPYGEAKREFIRCCEDALYGIGSAEFHMARPIDERELFHD